jgi:hypothetical protein
MARPTSTFQEMKSPLKKRADSFETVEELFGCLVLEHAG